MKLILLPEPEIWGCRILSLPTSRGQRLSPVGRVCRHVEPVHGDRDFLVLLTKVVMTDFDAIKVVVDMSEGR